MYVFFASIFNLFFFVELRVNFTNIFQVVELFYQHFNNTIFNINYINK